MRVLQMMSRSYVEPERMDETILFYEELLDTKFSMRFEIVELGIETALVGSVQVVAGAPEKLAPFRHVGTAYFVDSVIEFEGECEARKMQVLLPATQGPHGKYMVVRHPDGTSVEYADAQT